MSTEKINILITGANGFLGRNVLNALANEKNVRLVAACRDKSKLPASFQSEVRQGDLRDANYRQSLVKDIDIICHAGTWAAMWGHALEEKTNFYQPTVDLIEQAKNAGVKRFIMTSTVAAAKPTQHKSPNDDFAPPAYTKFWPHLDRLIDVEKYMKLNSEQGMQMTVMRLGHFIGAGNKLGLVPALVPRLKTYLVPWLSGGKSRLPLVTDKDLANAYVAACLADNLQSYESFNICGESFPTMREVINYINKKTGMPKPLYSVPYPAGYAFAWLMEKLFPIMPGKGPFLTRSIVHLAEDWYCNGEYAIQKLGYQPQKSWQIAMDEALEELKEHNYSWPYLAQH